MSKIIGVKVGSALLTDGKGGINLPFIGSLCHQISFLKNQGHYPFLVTSGAIASEPDKTMSENLRSAIGQPLLMGYYHFFLWGLYGLKTAQFLPNYLDLALDAPVFNRVFQEGLHNPAVIPIINYPDSLDNREVEAYHEFADNDQLFLRCCVFACADLAIIVSRDEFRDNRGVALRETRPTDEEKLQAYCRGGNSLGHGENGMQTKIQVLCSLSRQGISAYLVSGREENFLKRAFFGEKNFGLKFIPC